MDARSDPLFDLKLSTDEIKQTTDEIAGQEPLLKDCTLRSRYK